MPRQRPVMAYVFTECSQEQLKEHGKTHVVRASVKRGGCSKPPKRMLSAIKGDFRRKSTKRRKARKARTAQEAECLLGAALAAL